MMKNRSQQFSSTRVKRINYQYTLQKVREHLQSGIPGVVVVANFVVVVVGVVVVVVDVGVVVVEVDVFIACVVDLCTVVVLAAVGDVDVSNVSSPSGIAENPKYN